MQWKEYDWEMDFVVVVVAAAAVVHLVVSHSYILRTVSIAETIVSGVVSMK